MIYDIYSEQFAVYLFTGRKEPSMDQVCAALDVIREEYPKLAAEDVSLYNQTDISLHCSQREGVWSSHLVNWASARPCTT